MTTKTILLINGEASISELMQACLNQVGGWQVLIAASLLEGVQRAKQAQPDAIVVDLPLVDQGDFTFLQRLRAHPETQTIPVVVLTAGAKWLDAKRLQQFQVVGAIDYISDPNQLSKQIAKLLNWVE